MIKIAHLYYDLLNLYGENGNIKEIKYQLENNNIKFKIDLLTINDTINFNKYDLIYIGSGTQNNIKIVLKDIIKYKNDINNYINNNKIFIATGNSLDLFGEKILDDKKSYKTLSLFDYETTWEKMRMVDETILKCDFLQKDIIGFQNQNSTMNIKEGPFIVIKGIGSYPTSRYEGIIKSNFIGTYLIGPILVRNPELCEYVINKLNIKNIKYDFETSKKAYNKYASLYYKDIFNEKDYY